MRKFLTEEKIIPLWLWMLNAILSFVCGMSFGAVMI
jgi:hypothetical protein